MKRLQDTAYLVIGWAVLAFALLAFGAIMAIIGLATAGTLR